MGGMVCAKCKSLGSVREILSNGGEGGGLISSDPMGSLSFLESTSTG